MRFRYEHQDLAAAELLEKLVAEDFNGAVHRIDGPAAVRGVYVDVREDYRNAEVYARVRRITKDAGLVPHSENPEDGRVYARKA